ncbi:MAG: hypothetical protein ACHQ1G_05545 [Planctomycetota bacterium]|jgi:hypothetical protein
MTRKTGFILVAALALSVAALGLFLCTRCDGTKDAAPPPPRIDTLMIGDGPRAD